MEYSIEAFKGTLTSCPICLGDEAKPLVVHSGKNGALHPFHRDCLEVWLNQHPACPVCRAEIDRKFTISIHDKEVEAVIIIIIGLAAGFFCSLAIQHHFPNQVRFRDSGPAPFYSSIVSCALLNHRANLKPINYFMIPLALSIYFECETSS